MRILAFSDLHRDLDEAARLVEASGDADVVIGAGDFASIHEGLDETIADLLVVGVPEIDRLLAEHQRHDLNLHAGDVTPSGQLVTIL